MNCKVNNADVIEWCRNYKGEPFHSILCDPPAEYAPRRILIPFSGSGSEMIGAMQAGWEEVVGIEQDSEYCEIARRRIEYWDSQKAKTPAQVKQPQEQELVMA